MPSSRARRLRHFSFVAASLLGLMLAGHRLGAEEPPPDPNAAFDKEHAEKFAKGLELFKAGVGETLKQRCVKCHGGTETEAEFDLTTRAGLLKGGKSGAVVKLGKSGESRLQQLIGHKAEPEMPFGEEKLAEADLQRIAAWIDHGAPYDTPLVAGKEDKPWTEKVVSDQDRAFWSFQPLQQAEPPAVDDPAWNRTAIDRFVRAKLTTAGLTPSAPASREHLVRRVYFDLIGLPPTPEEVAAFLNDESPEAYEKLIDRLLASPRYGERWARRWLDLARFGESHGFEHDYDRPSAYHYRDFVIEALNQDLPYDSFVKWQLAGDEYAPDNDLALKATGFLAAGVHSTQITANEVEKHRYDEMDDMLGTISTSMLGLTISCARCHDHKFDPIPQADYYRLLSTFTTTVRSEVDLYPNREGDRIAREKFDAEHAPYAAALKQWDETQLPTRLAAWETAFVQEAKPAQWLLLEAKEVKSAGGATFQKQADGSYVVEGKNADHDTYTFVVESDARDVTAVRIEALAHQPLVKGGPGRADNGNFALSNFQVSVRPRGETTAVSKPVVLKNPRVTFEQTGLPLAAAIDTNPQSAWAIDPEFGKDQAGAFDLETVAGFEAGTEWTFTLEFKCNTKHNLGRFRLSFTNSAAPLELRGTGFPQAILTILAKPAADRTADELAALQTWYRPRDPDWKKLEEARLEHLKSQPQPKIIKALISTEGLAAVRLHTQGGDFLNETHFLRRGDTANKQGVAPPGFLQVLVKTPEKEAAWQQTPPEGARTSYRRRAFAEWITDTEHGGGTLLARVIVNRLWQFHLGRGIVATPSDFGIRGERPTHPELLDFLAGELIAQKWSLKAIHKQILLSETYRQSSAFDEAKASIDPVNAFLWRWTPRRLEAEVIRDSLLTVGGLLDTTMYGPGTLDTASRRRSIYFTVKRSQLIPMMQVFDAPDGLSGIGERPTTTIAPQALLLLNNPLTREAARQLSVRSRTAAQGDQAQSLRTAYRIALARPPADEELADGLAFLTAQSASYTTAGQPAALAEELALADFCQILLCLNEFVYVE